VHCTISIAIYTRCKCNLTKSSSLSVRPQSIPMTGSLGCIALHDSLPAAVERSVHLSVITIQSSTISHGQTFEL